ncbi:histidine kinase [Kribbella sp. VKM Ac-2568]|uniref:sensor histidine kinase n=1 Tax=Kribbella sp. VKM Ac-2568 TaxID=2512219 RepID=UPI00104EC74B|nr:histidine kinase [Kribbella sp. VKM Ac-2568]TCM48945.1 histidine kinase [Kribbella sp. VKM Ac-2568]
MSPRFGSIWLATAVCAAAGLVLALSALHPAGDGWPTTVYLLALVPLALAWLLAVRAPASPVGAAVAWLAASLLVIPALNAWGQMSWSAAGFANALSAVGWPWQLTGFLALLLVFPDGLLAGRRWMVIAVGVPVSALVVGVAMTVTMDYGEPHAFTAPVLVPEPIAMPLMIGALTFLLAVVVACSISIVLRYRRGNERTKQQLRWLILATGAVVALMVASWIVNSFGLIGEAAYGAFLLGILVLVPAAVAIAVLRYDLFEIDRILSDSVAWVLTTLIAAALLAGGVVLTGYLAGRDSVIGLTGSVFLVAVLVLPLYRRIHGAVGKVLDRDRTVLVAQIERFVMRVRDGSAEPEEVEQVLRSAVRDPQLTLLLADPAGTGLVDLTGTGQVAGGDWVRVPLRTASADIGVILVRPGSMRRLRRAKLAASAARLPIEVSRLRIGLRRALTEVDESRRRLVSATIDERRRLERDLHDGAQQQLVAIGMQLRAAQYRLRPDDPVSGDLDLAVERLEATVAELRRLAHGVRPASLDDGLPAALARLGAKCPLPVDFVVEETTSSEVVTVTAYFVVAEAMANVLKHARASRIGITVERQGDRLHVAVIDDGIGGVPADAGLTALRDRVGSVGGRLTVICGPTGGTTVEAVLPCAS